MDTCSISESDTNLTQNNLETAETTQSETIYKGKVVTLQRDTITEPGGKSYAREVVVHPGAVVIVPVDEEGRLLLVKQWRHPVGKVLTELPAGTLEVGEEPRSCAERELQEETGFKPAVLTAMGGFYSAPGFCTEYLHLFVAEGLTSSPLPADEDEHIELLTVSLAAALQMIEAGTICDAKSVAGILRYAAHQK